MFTPFTPLIRYLFIFPIRSCVLLFFCLHSSLCCYFISICAFIIPILNSPLHPSTCLLVFTYSRVILIFPFYHSSFIALLVLIIFIVSCLALSSSIHKLASSSFSYHSLSTASFLPSHYPQWLMLTLLSSYHPSTCVLSFTLPSSSYTIKSGGGEAVRRFFFFFSFLH